MADKSKLQPNWSLLMPAILLVIECIALIALHQLGYTIPQNLRYVFLALGIFLLFRIFRLLTATLRVKNALRQLKSVDKLVESGQLMTAIKEWKKLLLSLPEDKYLEILNSVEKVYEKEEMLDAVKETKMVQAESIEFFEAISAANNEKLISRQDWQNKAIALRNMIRDLPEEKEKQASASD
ncbi:MAG TPA: hypothetical protein DF984_03515 [Anaerolineaceae bacterium]|nr:hypothetical protein [Anaerolineaceae bacterium]